jgi:hypothetical protein
VLASDVVYDNSDSQLTASNVKGALDELDLKKADISLLSSNVTFYPTTATSDISGYFELVTAIIYPSFNTTAVNVNTGVLPQTNTLVASLVSESNVFKGDIGGITVTIIGNIRRSAGNAGAQFFFEVYHRTGAGTETLIGTSPNTDRVTSETYIQFFDSALIASQVFSETDRLVLKFYGIADGNNSAFDFQFGGTEPVRALFPVQVSVIPGVTTASAILTNTSDFNGILSGADTTVQAALNTLDDHGHGIADITGLQTELNSKLESSDLVSTNIVVTPHGTITSTNLQQALEQLADQKFVQVSTPTLNVENGDFWFNPDDETLYVYREVSTGVFNWVPIMIGNNSPDSDTIDAGSY